MNEQTYMFTAEAWILTFSYLCSPIFGLAEWTDKEFPDVLKERLQCYSCQNAISHESCNEHGMVACPNPHSSCETEVRMTHFGRRLMPRISKGCKQTQACKNNVSQNERASWPTTQCNRAEYFPLYVCRYCCEESGCNSNLDEPYCRELTPPENGKMECRMVQGVSSSVCRFTCDDCFVVTGSAVRRCRSNRLWTGDETKCVFDEACYASECDLEMTLPIRGGTVTCSQGRSVGSFCKFICDASHHRFGAKLVECMDDGRWSSEKPTCDKANTRINPCDELASFSFTGNGTLNCDCREGFQGDGYETCNDIDECATDDMNECHHLATCRNTVGSYTCECNLGLTGYGFECADIDECQTGDHDCGPNGICINEVGLYSCVCKAGYMGDGKTCTKVELKCPQDQLQDGLICIRKDVKKSQTSYTTASAIFTTTPDPGLSTKPSISSGQTTPVSTKTTDIDWCVTMEKGIPVIMKKFWVYDQINDVLTRRVIPPGDTRTVVLGPWIGMDDRFQRTVLRWSDGCLPEEAEYIRWAPGEPKIRNEPGFQNCVHLISDPVSYGTRSFLWKVIECSDDLRYSCDTEKIKHAKEVCKPPIGDIINGRGTCTDGWNVDSICTFECDPGYAMLGEYSPIQCVRQTLRWSNEIPKCVRAACIPPLSAPDGGRMTCSNGYSVGSECKFTCDTGYSMQGDSSVTCQSDGQWSASRPCCKDQCPPFARMNLIFILDSSSSVGANNFEDIKDFVLKLQDKFVISRDFTQVSAIVYHSKIKSLEGNKIFNSNKEFQKAISSLVYEGVGTLTGQALNYVTESLIGKRDGAQDVVILLTDGKSQDDVEEPARRLRQQNAHVIAVGVRRAKWAQLELIVSNPSSENVIGVDSYQELSATIDRMRDKVCKKLC